jgi:hypothetical protein
LKKKQIAAMNAIIDEHRLLQDIIRLLTSLNTKYL